MSAHSYRCARQSGPPWPPILRFGRRNRQRMVRLAPMRLRRCCEANQHRNQDFLIGPCGRNLQQQPMSTKLQHVETIESLFTMTGGDVKLLDGAISGCTAS
jgi:hypothetical protein